MNHSHCSFPSSAAQTLLSMPQSPELGRSVPQVDKARAAWALCRSWREHRTVGIVCMPCPVLPKYHQKMLHEAESRLVKEQRRGWLRGSSFSYSLVCFPVVSYNKKWKLLPPHCSPSTEVTAEMLGCSHPSSSWDLSRNSSFPLSEIQSRAEAACSLDTAWIKPVSGTKGYVFRSPSVHSRDSLVFPASNSWFRTQEPTQSWCSLFNPLINLKGGNCLITVPEEE